MNIPNYLIHKVKKDQSFRKQDTLFIFWHFWGITFFSMFAMFAYIFAGSTTVEVYVAYVECQQCVIFRNTYVSSKKGFISKSVTSVF